MATKRPAGEDGPLPPSKKPVLSQTPLPVLPATSQEDLDVKILQVKKKKNQMMFLEEKQLTELAGMFVTMPSYYGVDSEQKVIRTTARKELS